MIIEIAQQPLAGYTVNPFHLRISLPSHFTALTMKPAIILFFIAVTADDRTVKWRPLETLSRIMSKFHYGPPPLPVELAHFVTLEARREYNEIISNRALTIGEQEAKIKQWAETNDILDQVNDIEGDIMTVKNGLKEEVKEVIDFLPKAFKRFSEVVENKNLTLDEIGERTRELKARNFEAFRTLKFIFEQCTPRDGPYEFAE